MRIARILVLAAALLGTLAASAAAIDLEPQKFPDLVVGQYYEFEMDAEEGCLMSYKLTHILGNMPPGITIHHEGQPVKVSLRGTPEAPGTFTFDLDLRDNCNSIPSQNRYTMIVLPALAIQQASLPPAKVGQFYSVGLTATGGGTMFWSVVEGALPAGMSLDEKTGVLSGTPTALGSTPFTIQVRDPDPRKTRKPFTLNVVGDVSIAPLKLQKAEVGVAFSASLQSSGGLEPRTWAVVGKLPAGLALNPATGALSGRPSASGKFRVSFEVTDALGTKALVATRFSIAPRLTITTKALETRAGSAFDTGLRASGGTTTRVWRVASGTLPRGVRLDRATGALEGTPRRSGIFRVTFRVTDGLGGSATKRVVLSVA
ncbi:MAG TPA: Ig domain-containing protein [Gaiella sp.]|jgi:hypothetical protein